MIPEALALSAVLFTIGTIGVLTRRNAIMIFMCVELMLNAVNLSLVAFSRQYGMTGQVFVVFVMTVAAAEAAVGLAIINGRRFDVDPGKEVSWRHFYEMEPALARLGARLDFPNGFMRIKRPWGHAPGYGAPGAVLMGDAAHSVSPAGGQGANMSIADAVVLAELLLRGEPNLIAEYQRRRRPANERSLGPTRIAHSALALPGWMIPNVCRRVLLRWFTRHPAAVRRVLRSVSTLFREVPTP